MKSYTKNSRHNLYDPSWANHNMRISVEMRMKVEKKAEELGMTLAEFNRMIIGEAVKDVKLTSADIMEIARRVKENEERNKEKQNRGDH